jgi:hypothetical protein
MSTRAWLTGCAALALAACANARPPSVARALPDDSTERDRVLASFGERLYGAVATGHLEDVFATDRARDALLKPEAAQRTSIELASGKGGAEAAIAPSDRAVWRSARYAGLCIQSGRLELPSGALGLSKAGFVFERGLLIGREPAGGELAGWVEGVFVLTQEGFVALEIERIEPPRRDHSDLELAECELADHGGAPQDVVPNVYPTH